MRIYLLKELKKQLQNNKMNNVVFIKLGEYYELRR